MHHNVKSSCRSLQLLVNSVFAHHLELLTVDIKIYLRLSGERKLVYLSCSNFAPCILSGRLNCRRLHLEWSVSPQSILENPTTPTYHCQVVPVLVLHPLDTECMIETCFHLCCPSVTALHHWLIMMWNYATVSFCTGFVTVAMLELVIGWSCQNATQTV